MNLLTSVKKFDVFTKTHKDYSLKTFVGGSVSIIAIIIITVLIIFEFFNFMEVNRIDELYVDTSNEKKLNIFLDITFPSISCDALNVDVMDVSGEHQINVDHTIFKDRLDKNGKKIKGTQHRHFIKSRKKQNPKDQKSLVVSRDSTIKKKMNDPNYCGSCYGAEDVATTRKKGKPCCNSCDEVKEAYKKKNWAFRATERIEQCYFEIVKRKKTYSIDEGCRMHGFFSVNKVAGNFHFAPGKSYGTHRTHVHDYLPFEVNHYNTSHIINKLSFGKGYPGQKNPLDKIMKIVKKQYGISALFQYYIKVVPTIYEWGNGEKILTNQYSVTEHVRPRNARHPNVVPGVYFMFDLSPIMMHLKEQKKSILHFATNLCAIVGGIIAIFGIIDSILFQVMKTKTNKIINQ